MRGQADWVNRCNPELPGFRLKDWQDCISKENNPHFENCKKLITNKIQKNEEFAYAFSKTISDYADKHKTNATNGKAYMLEELTWILSLSLLHLNKPVYLIHVGVEGGAIRALFHHFVNLQKSVKWLSPRFSISVFENESDFLMDYKNSSHVGYSYAMENKQIVRPILTFKKENDSSKEELALSLSREINEKNTLHSIIGKLPGHVYWLNRDNVYLGCNDLQAENYGLKSRHDVIGKTNREFYPQKDADILDKNNIMVMETGVAFEGEEPVIMHGKYGSYLSYKTPLYDIHGKIVGLLGISIDITDRKRVEELEIQNKIQAEINRLSEQVSHDIQTPLAVMSMTLNQCKGISEEDHIKLRNAVTSIRTVSSHLLHKYTDEETIEKLADPIERYILVPHSLDDRISSKRYEYKNLDVIFNFIKGSEDPFIFIRGDFSNYFRMMSNLINNAVEAMEGSLKVVVDIGFNLRGQEVEIFVQDYGKGMPKETVDKILNDVEVGTTKEGGHGIGLQQIKRTIKQMNGRLLIDSKKNEGTRFSLIFQRSESPSWFVDKIVLPKGSTVVVLDDDVAIHKYWQTRLESYKDDIAVKCFTQGDETVEFINSSKEKNKIFLLTDYELRHQDINGIDVIEKCGLEKRSILLTSCYTSRIQDFPKKAEYIKFLIKAVMDTVPITVEESVSAESIGDGKSTNDSSNVILLDDCRDFADMAGDVLKSKGIKVAVYYHPEALLADISRYCFNTTIIMDNDFKCGMSGEILAKQLFDLGFTELYVLTGSPNKDLFLKYPKGTKFISKASRNYMDDIISSCKIGIP